MNLDHLKHFLKQFQRRKKKPAVDELDILILLYIESSDNAKLKMGLLGKMGLLKEFFFLLISIGSVSYLSCSSLRKICWSSSLKRIILLKK